MKMCLYRISLLVCLAMLSQTALAQTVKVTYDLENVWLLPDISHPNDDPRQMTGSFEWTYQLGDFENGTGEFTDIYIPWYNPGLENLEMTFDMNSIEFTLLGNWHDLGIDITLFLIEPLSPDRPSTIDTVESRFDIQYGVSWQGHVISGEIVPRPGLDLSVAGTCPSDVLISVNGCTPNGSVALLYAFGQGSFVIPGGLPCAGTMLGLDSTVAVGSVMTADANGQATLNTVVPEGACDVVFLQALDVTNCMISDVVQLQ